MGLRWKPMLVAFRRNKNGEMKFANYNCCSPCCGWAMAPASFLSYIPLKQPSYDPCSLLAMHCYVLIDRACHPSSGSFSTLCQERYFRSVVYWPIDQISIKLNVWHASCSLSRRVPGALPLLDSACHNCHSHRALICAQHPPRDINP